MSDRWVFVRPRVVYESGASLVSGSHGTEVPAGLREAESAVRTAANPVSIMVVLPVVFPEAHGTDLVVGTLLSRQEAATATLV